MPETSELTCVERGPANADASVIWLHGLGADGYDFVPIIPELGLPADLGIRFVFPHADERPVTLNGGMIMRAWYDIRAVDLDARSHDERGIRSSAAQVMRLIERERSRGIDSRRIVLAGFSQGGALAIHVALRSNHALAALVALSCYTVLSDSLHDETTQANANLPVFMAHGELDPVVPQRAGQVARDQLARLGHEVEWHSYPVPHAVHPQEIRDIGRFVERALRTKSDEDAEGRPA